MTTKAKESGANHARQGNSVLFSSMVKQFVISTIDMVKNNIHEEQNIIDQMLILLNNKMTKIRNTPSLTTQKQQTPNNNYRLSMHKIQSAVEQLNKDSDILSQRLFDISQTLVQNKINQIEQQKQNIQKSYENKLLKLKHNFQNQKMTLQSQLKHYKEKCSILQQCLNEREQFIVKQSKRVEQTRKIQLSKYLQAIELIYEQLQSIKNFSPLASLNKTESIEQYYNPHKYVHQNYSERYYNNRDEQQTQTGSDHHRLRYNQYYNRNNYDLQRQRSNSKNTNLQPKYVQIPLPRQNYYIQPHRQRLDRSRSTDKQKQERGSSYKTRPIIIQYQNSPQVKSPMKQSQIYIKRSLKLDNQSQQKRVDEKNLRMQGVQQKLHGLKRKLSRQLKNMKS